MLQPWFTALGVLLITGLVAWAYSLVRRSVSFVDSLWSLFFVAAAVVFALEQQALGVRAIVVIVLLTAWALRLSIYITARNWGQPEDYRYRSIRADNQPGFEFKSLYIVFGLQAALAWFISLPLLPAISSTRDLNFLDALAAITWLVGFVFEAGGDYQLARFRRRRKNAAAVLDEGLWRYTRHPNYFGDFCVWWAYYLFAVAAGGWWSIASPLLMSYLLLKVSGVAMLEATMPTRRPAYADYIKRTNAFFPGPRRRLRTSTGGRP